MIEDTDKCDNCNAECNQHKEDVFRFSVAAEMLERTTVKNKRGMPCNRHKPCL